jgi:adenylyltransferase/sulfurtransferase
MKKQLNVKVIGCGGVGGCLLNILPRYLTHLKDQIPSLTLVDGDTYEHRNSERQEFTRLGNKAEITADRIRREFPSLSVNSSGSFITKVNVPLFIKEGDLVFCCVDNHATRKLLSDHCEKLRNVVLFSGGNGTMNGNIQVHVRKDGVDVSTPITRFHKELESPKDVNPGDRDPACDVEIETTPQIIWVNNMIAGLMGMALYHYLSGVFDGKEVYDEIYMDGTNGIAARTVKKR